MTGPSFLPGGAIAEERGEVPRLSPYATSVIASVETVRAQLEAMRVALDTIVALVHAGESARITMANVVRERAARDRAPTGLPPIFGAPPAGFTSSSSESSHDDPIRNTGPAGGDVLGRIDANG